MGVFDKIFGKSPSVVNLINDEEAKEMVSTLAQVDLEEGVDYKDSEKTRAIGQNLLK